MGVTNKNIIKRRKLPESRMTRQAVMAMALIGIALTYMLINKAPGPQAFAAAMFIAVGYLLTTLAMWRTSYLLGILAIAVLLIAMFWDPERPFAALLGLTVAALNILEGLRDQDEADEEAALAEAEERQKPPAEIVYPEPSLPVEKAPLNYKESGGPIPPP